MTSSNQSFDVAIAGGGIVGSACALACAQRGLRVALVERDVLGSGATAAGMGHIVVMDDSEAQFALTQYSQELWHKLAPQLPSTSEYEQRGTLWIAADGEEMDAAERKHAWYATRSVPSELLSANQLRKAEPNLAEGFAGGLLVREDAVVYPPTAALELARRAQAMGAHLLMGKAVIGLGDGVLQLEDASEVRAQRIILALGAESVSLRPDLPIRKRKGHLVITDRYPGYVNHQLVELGYLKSAHSVSGDSVAFNVQPRSTGQLLIGSSRQYGSEYAAVDEHIVSAMLKRAMVYLPGLCHLSAIRVWTGFRAATPDKLPLIGPDSRDARLMLATGHEGLGITTSLATAELIADMLTEQRSAISPEPYLPARYAVDIANNRTLNDEEKHEVDWSHAGVDHGIQ
ncbi:MAG TPA: FAD-dependent oxidoreductase [Terracidiphilus sp.]|jgi:glycine/D-amino acid oxidase-like deaminating enzyme